MPDAKVDWFTEHLPRWETHVLPRLPAKGVRALIVGAYEGLPVAWLRTRLKRRLASVTVVEDFAADQPCVGFRGAGVWNPREDVEAAFARNSAPRRGAAPVELLRLAPSEGLLALRTQMRGADSAYDLVYVDARSSRHALECAVLAFPLLRQGGGVMAVTNYVHNRRHDAACPRRGVDAFLDSYAAEVKVLSSGFHVFLERRDVPFDLGPCRSEYYDGEEAPFPVCKKPRSLAKITRRRTRSPLLPH